MDTIVERWQGLQTLSEREMERLTLYLITKRVIQPKGWFNLRFKPVSIKHPVRSILLIPMAGIGDMVCTIPTISGIKDRFKDSSLSILVEEGLEEIVDRNPFVEEVIILSRKCDIAREFHSLIQRLQTKRFDLVINLNTVSWSAFISNLVKPRYTWGLTVDEGGNPLVCGNIWMLYAYYIRHNPPVRRISFRLNFTELFLRMAGLKPQGKLLQSPWAKEELKETAQTLASFGVKEDDLLIGLFPGASHLGKRWGYERFARLADRLGEMGLKTILFGGPEEVELCKSITDATRHKPIDLSGNTTLKELAGYLTRCESLITNDSGVMHLAAALGVPVLCIRGPTYGEPFGNSGHLIIQPNLSCIGCGDVNAHVCSYKRCFEAIEVDMVITALMFQIGRLSTPPKIPGIRLYYSGKERIERFFSYPTLYPRKVGPKKLSEEMLTILALNLWIIENNKIDLYEAPLSFEEIKNILNRSYQIENLDEAIKIGIDQLKEWERVSREGIELLEQRKVSDDLIKRLNEINKRLNQGVGRHLRFLGYLSLKGQDEMGWWLNLYRAKREACRYLQGFLEEWLSKRLNI